VTTTTGITYRCLRCAKTFTAEELAQPQQEPESGVAQTLNVSPEKAPNPLGVIAEVSRLVLSLSKEDQRKVAPLLRSLAEIVGLS